MAETTLANDGTKLPLSDLPTTLVFSGQFISTISVVYANPAGIDKTYIQTFTNDGTNITNISRFEVQP
jgi:hypothetical protein